MPRFLRNKMTFKWMLRDRGFLQRGCLWKHSLLAFGLILLLMPALLCDYALGVPLEKGVKAPDSETRLSRSSKKNIPLSLYRSVWDRHAYLTVTVKNEETSEALVVYVGHNSLSVYECDESFFGKLKRFINYAFLDNRRRSENPGFCTKGITKNFAIDLDAEMLGILTQAGIPIEDLVKSNLKKYEGQTGSWVQHDHLFGWKETLVVSDEQYNKTKSILENFFKYHFVSLEDLFLN